LANVDFNPLAFNELSQQTKPNEVMPQAPISYFLFILLIQLSIVFAAENWAYFLVGCNVALAVTASLLIVRLGEICRLSVAGILVILLFSAFTWESNQWIAMTQSESLYCLVSLLALMTIHKAWTNAPGIVGYRWWGSALLLVIICQFVRPTSLPILALLGFIFCFWLFARNYTLDVLRKRFFVASAILIVSIGLGIAAHAWIIFDPSSLQSQSLRDLANFFHPYHAKGWVVWVRPETYIPPPTTVAGFAEVSILRLAYFFWFLADDFSWAHKAVNLVTFVPLYFLFVVGIVAVLRKNSTYSRSIFVWASIAISYILMVDAYHSVTILDFDWRYRAVIYWALYLFAGIGADQLIVLTKDRLFAAQRE